jgi:short-subunit dehydrogenase
MTNFVAALAQAEAAMEIFRAQDAGHLVLVSSMSAMRGMPKSMTVYAATKAALSHLGEGLQYELLGKPIKVTVLHCGYIASEMNEKVQQQVKFMVSTEEGVRVDGRRHREGEGPRLRAALPGPPSPPS